MESYIMLYKISKDKANIRILGKNFVRNNGNKGKTIYKNKKFCMKETFGTKNIDIKIEDKLKIKVIINKNISNMSSIFENCESLLEFVRNNNFDYDVDYLDNIYKMEDIDNNSEVDSIIPLTEISLSSKKEDLLSFSQNDYFNYDYYDRDIDKKEYTFYQNSIISEIDKNEEKENSMLSTVLNIKQMVSNIILNQN